MDKVGKFIKRLVPKEKARIRNIFKALQSGRFSGLDVKKLKGAADLFRVKKGDLRIIYQVRDSQVFILKIGYRKEDTYKL